MLIGASRQMPQLRVGFGESSRIVQVAVVREKSRIHGGAGGLTKVRTKEYLHLDNSQCLNSSIYQPCHDCGLIAMDHSTMKVRGSPNLRESAYWCYQEQPPWAFW